jgi:hypothetical protein
MVDRGRIKGTVSEKNSVKVNRVSDMHTLNPRSKNHCYKNLKVDVSYLKFCFKSSVVRCLSYQLGFFRPHTPSLK